MKKPIKILITEPEYFTDESLVRMKRAGIVTVKRMLRKDLLKFVKNVDILVVRIETKVDKELLKHAKHLKVVVSATTGLNHIDVKALKARGIKLYSLHGIHSVSTAEHTIALLFSVVRNIIPAHEHMINGQWKRWKFIGTELNKKTIGIFGLGRVGSEVAVRAKGLGMNVVAYDPYVSKSRMTKLGVKKVDFTSLLKRSDIITLHASLTKETYGIFGNKEIRMMKSSVVLINTARGSLIKEKALVEALTKGYIRAAAIDVYQEEPQSSLSPIVRYGKKHSNLVLTPHLGASTREAMMDASMFAVDVIENFVKS
jgi:D-3-phosphoglycerate dehydrogenase